MSILSATQVDTVKNYIGGEWKASESAELLNVVNPATQKILTAVPVSDAAEVNAAIAAASRRIQDGGGPLPRIAFSIFSS